MKSLAAVLLFGAVLLAALPVAADGISHPGVGKEFSGFLVIDKFDGNKNADLWDSSSFLLEHNFFFGLWDDKFRRDGLMDWNIEKRGSFELPGWKGWSVEDQGRDWNRHIKKEDLGSTLIPEPGSLSLLLFGLAVVGFLRPRRTILATTT